MKIQIASDLHLQSRPYQLPDPSIFRSARDRDVLVLPGNIGRRHDARIFIMCELPISPVIYVPGRFEYHTRAPRETVDREWRQAAEECPGLHYLVAEGVAIDGVRFWGAPWYSDLSGTADAMTAVERRMEDFQSPLNAEGAWMPSRHLEAHRHQTRLLRARAGDVDVVVTHWSPTKAGMPTTIEDDALAPYFYNDRDDLVETVGARLWISGHPHACLDYSVGSTRLVSNPAGEADEHRTSPLFQPDKIVELRP